MFRCERCGSRYSAMHAVSIETCPRCQARDRISSPLTFKAFQQRDEVSAKPLRMTSRFIEMTSSRISA